MHRQTPRGEWAIELVPCTAKVHGGSGQCNSCNALPHYPGAVGSGTSAIHCLTTWGQWAVQIVQCHAPLPGGSGHCDSCNTLPHCRAQWAVQLLQCYLIMWGQWAVEDLH